MLSLSYDYDTLSLGLLKNQVRKMSVQLNDQPTGCLAKLNSSCQNKVVGRVLLGNVTASSAKKFRKDVVCVAEIDDHLNFLENFFEGDVEYRCCKIVKFGRADSIQCEQNVERSIWFNAFYVVLNILTVFVAIYLPALLLLALPDFIFNLRKEYEKEKEEKRTKTKEPWERFLEVLVWLQMPNRICDYLLLPGSTPDNFPRVGISSARRKARKSTHSKKEDQIPVDDGSPFTLSRLFRLCNSGAEAFQGLVKFSFNIKLLILWYCIMPFFVIIEFVLFQTIKDQFSEEIATKSEAFLVGKLFFLTDMSRLGNHLIFFVSYIAIPSIVIKILKKEDFIEKEKPCPLCFAKPPRYVGEEVWNHLKIIPKIVGLVFPNVLKLPIVFFLGFQIFCSNWMFKYYYNLRRYQRYRASWYLLLVTVLALIITVALTAFIWFVFLIYVFMLLVICSPQFTVLIFASQKGRKFPFYFYGFVILLAGACLLFLIFPVTHPVLLVGFFPIIYPIFLGLHFCRFIVRMFGFTIIGLTFNDEIAAPLVTFTWLITSYMHECLCNFQGLYRDVKQVIYQEWQKGIEKLDEKVRPKTTNDTIPTDLFWYVCNESEVLPVWFEMSLMFGKIAVIFLFTFFALSAIFFGTNNYQIPTVASTIAVYVSGKFPMLVLREMHKLNFSGWKKIERNEKIKMSVNEFIKKNYDSQRKRCATI